MLLQWPKTPGLPCWSIGLIVLAYMALVRLLRYERARSLQIQYSPQGRASFAEMTTSDAQKILKDLTELEFPKVFGFSIIFALFKTYGIPSISSLLLATGQLRSLETASKRIADTGVIMLEFALNDPTSDRALKAIARMNYLHGPYQKSGKITNDDLLYTLSLFALEPSRWVAKYEWRSLSDLELAACGTYWKSMGDAMGIDFSVLQSDKQGWQDGLSWLRTIEEWSVRYEEQHMVPAKSNQQLADSHLDILCLNIPRSYLPMCKNAMSVLLGSRLQRAMLYPDPPKRYISAITWILAVRKFVIRHLALPRPEFMRKNYIPEKPNIKSGRYNAVEYLSHPWYVKPTLTHRWGPRAWLTRAVGRKLPGDDGNKYAPEGWAFDELGPRAMKGKGNDEMNEILSSLSAQKRGGCPFA